MNYEDIKTSKYYLYYGSGVGAGTWFIERLADGALTQRATGVEARYKYQKLKRLWRRAPELFDDAVTQEYQFEKGSEVDVKVSG